MERSFKLIKLFVTKLLETDVIEKLEIEDTIKALESEYKKDFEAILCKFKYGTKDNLEKLEKLIESVPAHSFTYKGKELKLEHWSRGELERLYILL